MWIALTSGWISAVLAREGDGAYGKPLDPHRIMIRARDPACIEQLLSEHHYILGDVKPLFSPNADYPVRIIIPKDHWVTLAGKLAESIDYGNFKSAVYDAQGHTPYESALHKVWSTMRASEPPCVRSE